MSSVANVNFDNGVNIFVTLKKDIRGVIDKRYLTAKTDYHWSIWNILISLEWYSMYLLQVQSDEMDRLAKVIEIEKESVLGYGREAEEGWK